MVVLEILGPVLDHGPGWLSRRTLGGEVDEAAVSGMLFEGITTEADLCYHPENREGYLEPSTAVRGADNRLSQHDGML